MQLQVKCWRALRRLNSFLTGGGGNLPLTLQASYALVALLDSIGERVGLAWLSVSRVDRQPGLAKLPDVSEGSLRCVARHPDSLSARRCAASTDR
jgi:hypothetical protein